jgi:hypothetical protein
MTNCFCLVDDFVFKRKAKEAAGSANGESIRRWLEQFPPFSLVYS